MGGIAATDEIVIRDRVSRVIAEALIEQLIAYRGSVVIELRFLQLSDNGHLAYGVNLTNTFNCHLWRQPALANPTVERGPQGLRRRARISPSPRSRRASWR